MRRGCVAFLALALIAVALVGCGRFGFEQREPWRVQAEESCLAAKLVTPTAYMSRAAEINGPGVCGITYPFKIAAFAGGQVGLSNKVTLACPMIPEIDGWLSDTVQPAAELYLGTTVVEMRAGTYSCRGRNNQAGAKTSEHAFGNAIDVMSFRFADGRSLSIEKGWKGESQDQDFLREIFLGACRHFTTVLAPGSDVFHYNHLHLDLARHDPRGTRRICKPIIKFAPRLDPDRPAERSVIRPRPAITPLPEPDEPLDGEDEGDPYALSSGGSSSPARLPETAAPATRPAYAAQPASTYQAGRPAPGYAAAGQAAPSPRQPAGTGAPLVLQPHLWSGNPAR